VYPGLRYIIVYGRVPGGARPADELGVVDTSPQDLLGESWHNGKVILAWDSVLCGSRNFFDGQNVVLHEFAHQLDSEDGAVDGTPLLGGEHSYRSWAGVLSAEFAELREASYHGRESLLDHYGASNPAEFVAEPSSKTHGGWHGITRSFSQSCNPTTISIHGRGGTRAAGGECRAGLAAEKDGPALGRRRGKERCNGSQVERIGRAARLLLGPARDGILPGRLLQHRPRGCGPAHRVHACNGGIPGVFRRTSCFS
jgi:hypothetical protein